ncbi:hypothetical protein KY289_034476 [Solanum tuberosum]|nr:hypothetical protein KY289_034476 [Solanum tuberosum]
MSEVLINFQRVLVKDLTKEGLWTTMMSDDMVFEPEDSEGMGPDEEEEEFEHMTLKFMKTLITGNQD